jgi:hypothetical protein
MPYRSITYWIDKAHFSVSLSETATWRDRPGFSTVRPK